MKNLFLTLIGLCIVILSYAQKPCKDKVHDITLNFKSKSFTSNLCELEKLKKGNFYRVVIDNIDLSTYKVILNNTDSSMIAPLDLSEFTGFDTDGVSKLLSGIVNYTTGAMVDSRTEDVPFTPGGSNWNNIDEEVVFSKDTLKLILKSIYSAQSNIEDGKGDVFRFQVRLQNIVNNEYLELALVKSKCKDQLDCSKLQEFSAEINKLRNEFDSLFFKKLGEKKEYLKKISSYYSEIQGVKSLADINSSILSNYDSLLKAYSVSLEVINYPKVNEFYLEMIKHMSRKTSTYTSLPLQFSKDLTLLSLEIKPWKDSSNIQSYSTEINFPVYRKSYFAIGTGVYFSGMENHSFSIAGNQLTDTTSGYHLVQEDQLNREVGATIQLQVGRKFGGDGVFGAHGTIGTGFSFTSSIKPRLLLGVGVSVGNQHRLTLNGGLITGYVDRLSNAFKVGEEYQYSQAPDNVLVSQVDTSLFGSIGYVFVF